VIVVTEVALILVISIAGTGGELCVARAMKGVGEVVDFRPSALLQTLSGARTIWWLWLGVALMAVSFLALLMMLSVENVSFVIPLTALSYVIGALGGAFFLGERVDSQRWIGVLLVCAGVALVFVGGR
jgi:drug/metabolite transporter (DMT)-like permease